jgi:hypothetical protein
MGYRTLFEGSGIHHSNTGLQIAHMYINGYFKLLFPLTPDRGASDAHTSLPEMVISGSNCNLAGHYSRRSLACCTSNTIYSPHKFLAQSHDRFLIHKMDTWRFICTLRDLTSFLDVFPSDLLQSSRPVLNPCTLIVNADLYTEGGSHWLAIRVTPRSSSAYYFDSYGIVPLITTIQHFLKRHCTTW